MIRKFDNLITETKHLIVNLRSINLSILSPRASKRL